VETIADDTSKVWNPQMRTIYSGLSTPPETMACHQRNGERSARSPNQDIFCDAATEKEKLEKLSVDFPPECKYNIPRH